MRYQALHVALLALALAACSDSGSDPVSSPDSGVDSTPDVEDADVRGDVAVDAPADVSDVRGDLEPDLDEPGSPDVIEEPDASDAADGADGDTAPDVIYDCDSFALTSATLPTLPLRTQFIGYEGGSGQVRWQFAEDGNLSGASVGEETGQYLSGAIEGVIDRVEVIDVPCERTLVAQVPIVFPAGVEPLNPIVPSGRTLCFEASGGTSDLEEIDAPFAWEVSIAGSGPGATVDQDGCYTAGDGTGTDIVRVEDRVTGQLLQVAVEVVEAIDELLVSSPRVLMVPGDSFDVSIAGGSGVYLFEFEGRPGTGSTLEAVEGHPEILRIRAGATAGTDFVRIRDANFPDILGHLDLGVMSVVHHDPVPYGAHGDDMDIQSIGDVNGDGLPDFAASSAQAGINGSYAGAVYIYLGTEDGFAPEPAQIITGYRRYDRLGRQIAAGDFNDDGCADLAVGVWGEPLAGSERGEIRVFTGCNDTPRDPEDRINWNNRLGDNLPNPARVEPLALYDRIQGGQRNSDRFGFSITAGDFNGDGRDDLASTAYQAETQVWIDPEDGDPFRDLGRGYLFFQRDDGFNDLADVLLDGVHMTPEGEFAGRDRNYFGWDLWAEDLNGDLCADLVVGNGRSDDSHGYVSLYLSEQSDEHPSGCALRELPSVTINPAPSDRNRAGRLGYVVRTGDFDGDCLADVVVNQYTAGSNGNNGRVLVFLNPGWGGATQYLTTEDADARFEADRDDQFGFSLAVGDVDGDDILDVLASGRYAEGEGTVPNVGEIRVYRGLIDGSECVGREEGAPLFAEPETGLGRPDQYIGFFAQRLAVVPDVDGDGVNEVVQFAERGRESDHPLDHMGSVLWRPSTSEGWDFASWTRLVRPDVEHDDHFGWRTERVGDVNNDGHQDLLVTADGYDLPIARNGYVDVQSNAGVAYLFFGGPDGVGAQPDMIIHRHDSHSGFDRFGYAAAGIGDFDGDGIDDFAVASPFDDNNGLCAQCRNAGPYRNDTGSMLVYLGRDDLGQQRVGQDPIQELITPDFIVCGPQQNNLRISREMVGGGDINGDGYDDIISSNWNRSGARGEVYVTYGMERVEPAARICLDPGASLGQADGGGDLMGYGLGAADLDGDGCAEVIAGAPNDDFPGRGNAGAIHVFRGAGAGCAESNARVVFIGERAGDNIGYRLVVISDLTGDEIPEVVVGSSGYGVTNFGAALILDGGRLGQAMATAQDDEVIPLSAEFYVARLLTPAQATGTGFAYDIDTLGDVDGDGRDDLIIGERFYSEADVLRRGAAWVYLSDENPEALAQPDLVVPGNAAFSNSDFGAAVTGAFVGGSAAIMVGAWIAEWEGTQYGEMGEVYVGHVNFRRR